jgi:hypothetical protein
MQLKALGATPDLTRSVNNETEVAMKISIASISLLFLAVSTAQAAGKTQLHFNALPLNETISFDDLEGLCYAGDPAGVGAVIDNLIEKEVVAYWSTILAIRYGKKTEVREHMQFTQDQKGNLIERNGDAEPLTAEELDDLGHTELLAEWNAYPRKSKEVWVFSNIGMQGDGTELYLTKIPACK